MENSVDYLFKPIVLVTGFGPFVNHPVNASWEAVKRMDKDKIERKHNIELVQLEIPVTYHNVDEFVPAIWETHEPKLMLHVGVSSVATQMTIEGQAHRKGYQRQDYYDQRPANHTCLAEGAVRLQTQLNVERICQEYNESNPEEKTSAVSSMDAGRYLCEYIYYTSLSHDNTRTLFVHVPDTPIYSPDQSARGLERILDLCLTQLEEAEGATNIADKLEHTNISENEKCRFQSQTTPATPILDLSDSIIQLYSPITEDSFNSIRSMLKYGNHLPSTSKEVKSVVQYEKLQTSCKENSETSSNSNSSKQTDTSEESECSAVSNSLSNKTQLNSESSNSYQSSKSTITTEESEETSKESSRSVIKLLLEDAVENDTVAATLKEIFSRKDALPENDSQEYH